MDARFVIQQHTRGKDVHWDLMLEKGNALLTFRLAEPPDAARKGVVGAERIVDHPLRFLTYEGPVQNGTGQVRPVDQGTVRFLTETNDRIGLHLNGRLLVGSFTLTRTTGGAWQFAARERPQ